MNVGGPRRRSGIVLLGKTTKGHDGGNEETRVKWPNVGGGSKKRSNVQAPTGTHQVQ